MFADRGISVRVSHPANPGQQGAHFAEVRIFVSVGISAQFFEFFVDMSTWDCRFLGLTHRRTEPRRSLMTRVKVVSDHSIRIPLVQHVAIVLAFLHLTQTDIE